MKLLGDKQTKAEQEAEKNRQNQVHNTAQRSMFSQDRDDDPEYFEEMVNHGVDESTALHVSNLLSKDFVLANLSNAEVDEMKWLFRVIELKIQAMHPPEESAIQGEYRRFLHDDESDELTSLTDDDLVQIKEVVFDVIARLSRSKDGWQQEEFGKNIQVSELKDNKEKQSGGLF